VPAQTDTRPDLERKSAVITPESGLLAADDETGVVETLVSITGIEDEVKDTIYPGAYTDTLAKRIPKGIFGHDWSKWVARTETVKELMPGDPSLPKTTRDGKPWPAEAGALYIKCRFNLNTDDGRNAYQNVKFFSETGECEWSIGYQVPKGKSTRTKSGGRGIQALDLFEYSPVLFGAAPLSGTLTVKAVSTGQNGGADPDAAGPDGADQNVGVDYGSGSIVSDPVTQEADSEDPEIAALHGAAMAEMDAADDGWDAVNAASAIDPGEEDLAQGVNDTDATDIGAGAPDEDADAASSGSKLVLDGGVTLEFKDSPAAAKSGPKVSDTPWSDFTAADYNPAQWHKACLIHNHGPGVPTTKADCKLPVREPDGTLNSNGVSAAAGALAGARSSIQASDAQKAKAAAALTGMYKTMGAEPPESLQAKVAEIRAALQAKVAGQDVSPKDVAATARLKAWYTAGGGAAEIDWGVPGDFMRCVAIAGKHMDPDKAKGYCQLRHKDSTGFYAGHAPAEQAGHAAHAAVAAAATGKKDLADGYDPALESGPLAGTAAPAGAETKAAPVLDVPGSLEQHLDQVQDAVTVALGAGEQLPGGLPRNLVTVNGTWPDHVIATRFDMTSAGDDGEAFQIPYTVAADGTVQLGDAEPVTLTVTAESGDGTKTLAEEELSAVPVLIEHITGHIRRGLQFKQGRVLSDVNVKLLRGAVDQLISVLTNAGIAIDVPGNETGEDQQDAEEGQSGVEPVYLPDSTAPAAQVLSGKVLLEPSLVARAYAIQAAAHSGDD
jgi:hypothetical protein